MKRTTIALSDLAHNFSVSDVSIPVPLNIGYVKAYCDAKFGDDVNIKLFKHAEKFLEFICDEEPPIVGLSFYGWNENLNHEIGQYIRKSFPGTLIVGGGPNIDQDPILQLEKLRRHSYLDFYVIDGGEEPFAELVEWWTEAPGNYDTLPTNLIWEQGGTIRNTGTRALIKSITNIPSPYLNGSLDEFLEAGMVPLLETNRGCPFKCTFCAWGEASKDLVRRLDIDTTISEIDYIGERSRARNWIVCDANFGILKRDIEIAKKIRNIKDKYGAPEKCHVWLSKNTMSRNLEVAEILGDMVVPVMAVQSLDKDVLQNIKRDNISTETYTEYQKKFHSIGSETYSDLIVPLPGETLDTHLCALKQLCDYGVDIIQNHNMRLLSGAETNSIETRSQFKFKTKYRLIHGDAGIYKLPDGGEIRVFEYEESLRETNTMPENDVFYLRNLHFLIDFCWNLGVYKSLLRVGQIYGINPIDVIVEMLDIALLSSDAEGDRCGRLFTHFNKASREEWFDSADDIITHFSIADNFQRLVNQDLEKLNTMFSLILLKEYKQEADELIFHVMKTSKQIPDEVLMHAANVSFQTFPALAEAQKEIEVPIPENFSDLTRENAKSFLPSENMKVTCLTESDERRQIRHIIDTSHGKTLSKILNTQGVSLADLRMTVNSGLDFDEHFRRAF